MDAIQLKHNQINNEIMKRNVPNQPIQIYFGIPSVNTRYVIQPKYDFSTPPCMLPKKDNGERLGISSLQHSTYNTNTYFYPGDRKAPFSGFSSNINIESELRNQHVRLSRTDNHAYVPTSKSNL
jgi:hypothetical protein